jgi:broad specificity phosphatase PhoE
MTAAPSATRWWWVRHALVVSHGGKCYGQTDVPCELSDSKAFAGLARRLPREAVWVTSTLRRTHMTAAAIVAAGLPGPDPIPGADVVTEPDLMEQHFGDWQGLPYAEIAQRHGTGVPFWRGPAHIRPPGGESFAELTCRVQAVIGRLSDRFAGRDIISVGHGGTIRAALGLALGLDPDRALAFDIDNLSLTRIEHFPEPDSGWRVVTVNHAP